MVFEPSHVQKKYWNIAKRLTTAELQKSDSRSDYLLEEDLFNVNIGKRGNELFLGFYSKQGLNLVFEKYGIFNTLKNIGFKSPLLDIDTSDAYVHKLTIHDKSKKPENLLAEIVLKKEIITIDMPFKTSLNGRQFEVLAIEWMSMQNPKKLFSADRPQLPGQQYPGLGIASKAIELLIIISWRLKLSGLLNTPDHYHNAYLYSRIFFYLDPGFQARLKALHRDMAGHSLDEAAWALEWGAVKDLNTNQPLKWTPGKEIVPLNSDIKKLFNSFTYRLLVKKMSKNFKYELDMEKYREFKERKNK